LPLFFLLVGTGRPFFRVTLFLHLISVAALAILMFRFSVRAALVWVFAFVALLPPFVQNVAFLSTEAITGSFLAIGFASLCLFIVERRWPYCALASFFFAWAALTRPTNVITPFLLVFLLLLFLGKRLLRAAVVLVCLTTLLVGSYVGYNAFKFHYLGFTYQTGSYLTSITTELYPEIDNPIAREELLKGRNEMYAAGMNPHDAVWRARKPLEERLGLSEVQLAKFLMRMNVRLITHHPQAYLEAVAQAATSYWFPYVTKLIGGTSIRTLLWDAMEDLLAAIFLIEVVMLTGMAMGFKILTGKFVLMGDRTLAYLMALGIIFQTQIVSCAVIGASIPRYRSVTELLILFAILLVADWALAARHSTSVANLAVSRLND
jgi:hypothetical protein